ncbi:MAG TPA: serine/threonine-protein kinase, partial [Kofleriaceae bacterium]
YHIMEYVDGATLTRVLDSTKLTSAACARIGALIADALAAAHHASVIHRDVKPSNLIVTTSPPGVRVLDFGVSKIQAWGDQSELTSTQDTLGTPEYMAPEQLLKSSKVTGAADVYSLGVVMYRAISGERPWPSVFVAAHAEREPTDVRTLAPDVNPALAAVIARCIAKDPTRRPTAARLASELNAIADSLDAPSADALAGSLLGEGATLAERGAAKKDETISERPVARPAR